MKYDFLEALENGDIVKVQVFETDKGVYRITLIRYKDAVYFYKCLDGELVECSNLNKVKPINDWRDINDK